MEHIFHERQEGSLCAQHCLNVLLQGSYFTAVDLGAISEQLDEQEREHMAEAGITSDDYRRFLNQPSTNMDDSGFFSVQVISQALSIWGLEMIPYTSASPLAAEARANPVAEAAFVCNFREHWLTIRKLGNQWFNLNSMLTGPELISETYLSLFLTQLTQDGYSIFVIAGKLPDCEADTLLKLIPAVQLTRPRLLRTRPSDATNPSGTEKAENPNSGDDDLAVLQALLASKNDLDDEDSSLQRAMELSLQEETEQNLNNSARGGAIGGSHWSEVRSNSSEITVADSSSAASLLDSETEEESLQRAMELSLQASQGKPAASQSPTTPRNADPGSTAASSSDVAGASSNSQNAKEVEKSLSMEEVRKKRLEFLEGKKSNPERAETNDSNSVINTSSQQQLQQNGVAEESPTEEELLALALEISKQVDS